MKYRLPMQAGLMLACVLLTCLAQAEELFDADGYRSSQYRSPTPSSLEGVQVVDTPALQKLLAERPDTRLIDVYRRPFVQDRFVEDAPPTPICPAVCGWPMPATAIWPHNGSATSPTTCTSRAVATCANPSCSTAAPTAG